MFVKEIMSTPAITTGMNETLDRVARKMWDNDCGSVPVVDAEGKLTGIITDRDICMAAYTQGKPLNTISVKSAMAGTVFACRPEDPVSEAEKLMSTRQVRRVPVVNAKGEPVGVLSLNDLARGAAGVKGTKREIAGPDVLKTLAAVCEPRRHKVPMV